MDWWDKLSFGLAALLMVGILAVFAWALVVDSHCKKLGWAKGDIALSGGYCIARTDQTDVVVPWLEAQRR